MFPMILFSVVYTKNLHVVFKCSFHWICVKARVTFQYIALIGLIIHFPHAVCTFDM